MSIQLSTTLRNAMIDQVTAVAGTSALIRIFSGVKPATPATALSGNTQLAELACSSTLAGSASSGILTLSAVSNDVAADATGTATFFRLYKSDGTTCVLQGTIGTSDTDMIVATTSFVANAVISISAFTLTAPGA